MAVTLLPNAVQLPKDEILKQQSQHQKLTMEDLEVKMTRRTFLHTIHMAIISLRLPSLAFLSDAKGKLGHYLPISLLVT